MLELDTIHCGDNCDLLGQLPRECIDLVVTSPPYDDLRTYGGHSWDFFGVAWQLRRVLKPGGRLAIYVTDAGTMRRWKFAGPDTHRLFTDEEVRARLVEGGFDPHAIDIERIGLPGGVRGLVATAIRNAQ